MKVLFLGSNEFSLPSLRLLAEKKLISAVITRSSKKKGRGLIKGPTLVGREAKQLGLDLYELDSFKDLNFEVVRNSDILVSASFGLYIPPSVYKSLPFGGINIHPSLLPKYRGPVPIERALMAGEKITGVTIFCLTKGIDEGDILAKEEVKIGEKENFGELNYRLAEVGARLLWKVLQDLKRGKVVREPQDNSKATYFSFIRPEERLIDWSQESKEIFNLVRALSPKPGAITRYQNEAWKILQVDFTDDLEINEEGLKEELKILQGESEGSFKVYKENLLVKCKNAILKILRLQRPGREPQAASSFLRGFRIAEGRFD